MNFHLKYGLGVEFIDYKRELILETALASFAV